MADKCDMAAAGEMVAEAFRAYGEWLARWRDDHPEDDRDDYDLADVYYRERVGGG